MQFVFIRSGQRLYYSPDKAMRLPLRQARYLCALASAGNGYITERILLNLGADPTLRVCRPTTKFPEESGAGAMRATVGLLRRAFQDLVPGCEPMVRVHMKTSHVGQRLLVDVELRD